MIEVAAASKSFGDRHLWSDVNLTIESGEMVALVGPSGSGKSTLLNCLGLLEPLDGGRIMVGGKDITRLSPGRARRFRRDTLGYLFQNYALIESASVRQNLDVVIGVGDRFRRAAVRERQERALEAVGMAGRSATKVFTLSGGEQQRVALARLLVKQPAIILADEPTGALDDDNAAMVMQALRSFAEQGSAVVVATHSDFVKSRSDRVIDVRTLGPQAKVVEPALR
ncbi:ABC transporter-like protein [Nocardioides sp. CF8]|uniref:ATP-binding cassette domain-containing protein n=1 Tax=Nocardioides sp. CF8 TaxID=110319 RepID=UPI00032F1FD2|nr:ATP-binding cassette domain-containing protein [Nocardioides sp. CF8]EON25736.1 ABC transporter-like protein [Nocardioides sp. CF8]